MSYIGNSITQQSFTGGVDQYNGNNSNTAFGLTRTINTVYDVDAYVENVWQRPTTGYTVSANTITFTSAPPAGSNNVVVVYRNFSATSIIPQQGSVVASSLSANLIPSVISGSALSGITTLAAGNTTITGTANVSQGLTTNTLTTSTNTATFGTAVYHVANGNLGIGTSSPSSKLDTIVTTGSSIAIRPTAGTGNALQTGIRLYGDENVLDSRYAEIGCFNGSGTNINNIVFRTGYATTITESMRINTNGNVILQGGTTTASGVGITFPATQVSSSDANCLDDYEEGTFTVTLVPVGGTGGGTITGADYGKYTKIGNIVHAVYQLNNVTLPAYTGQFGLSVPFPCAGGYEHRSGDIYFYPNASWTTGASFVGMTASINTGNSYLSLSVYNYNGDRQTYQGTTSTAKPVSGASSVYLRFNIIYTTAT